MRPPVFSDAAYEAAGVEVVKTAAALWKAAEIVVKVRPPTEAEAKRLRKDQTSDLVLLARPERGIARAGQIQRART